MYNDNMIHYYSIDNFRSIKEKVVVDFVASKHRNSLSKETYWENNQKEYISLVEMMIGPQRLRKD